MGISLIDSQLMTVKGFRNHLKAMKIEKRIDDDWSYERNELKLQLQYLAKDCKNILATIGE